MPEYVLSLHFGAADEAQARRLADAIAGTCAVEYGTRNPELHRVNRYPEDYPYCVFCETPADVHPEPLCSPGVVRELHAELQQARAELDTYHAAAYSTDLDGDVRDHLHDLADWDDTDGSAPGWLVDAVMGLLAPHRARAEQAETAVTAHKTAIIEALQRAEQAEAEVKRIRAELDAWKARAEDAERGSIPQLREARQRAEQAEAAIKRARALHHAEPADGRLYCVADDHPAPCPTIRAIDGSNHDA